VGDRIHSGYFPIPGLISRDPQNIDHPQHEAGALVNANPTQAPQHHTSPSSLPLKSSCASRILRATTRTLAVSNEKQVTRRAAPQLHRTVSDNITYGKMVTWFVTSPPTENRPQPY
jgi:hypothetical protein